jgi:hypothetical protein
MELTGHEYVLHLSSLGCGPMAGLCEHGNGTVALITKVKVSLCLSN